MKKTLITSTTLALGLGAAGLASGGHADAAEQGGVNQAQLADKAQNHQEELNEAPIQDGAYNYNFDYDNTDYNFDSDGTNWSWSYNGYGNGDVQTSQNVDQSGANAQQPQQQTEQPPQEAAPQTEQTQQPQQESTSASDQSSSNEEASSGSGGTNNHLKQIAQRESGGDYKAQNPTTSASGKYQIMDETWNSFAPSEYKGMSAKDAPADVQDQVAQKIYDEEGPSQWVTA